MNLEHITTLHAVFCLDLGAARQDRLARWPLLPQFWPQKRTGHAFMIPIDAMFS